MNKIKFSFKKHTVLEKISALRTRAMAQRNNGHFSDLSPSPDEMEEEANRLEAAYLAREEAQGTVLTLTSELNDASLKADAMLVANAADIEKQSKGDVSKLKSSGHELRNVPAPIGALAAPELRVKDGPREGELELSCRLIRGAGSYIFEVSEESTGNGSWKQVKVQKKSTYLHGGLTAGKRYWLRMAAVGSEGTGPWSGVVSQIVR